MVTRFAPSPTGRLHLGHAASAIRAHDFARARGGRFLLRIEDIDGTRSREEHVAGMLDDLVWLGLTWDGPVVRQSERLPLYAGALERLKAMGLLYPCFCTRADIAREAAASLSAPHGADGAIYPGTCRGIDRGTAQRRAANEPHAWRLDMNRAVERTQSPSPAKAGAQLRHARKESAPLHDIGHSGWAPASAGERKRGLLWQDGAAGTVIADPLPHGDVILARKDAPASYHLAVTIDDAAQGVTDVVRGGDLFAATHVHRLLQALLDLPAPRYHHHPLLTDQSGQRLAKRTGAPALADLRAAGVDGQRLAAELRAGIGKSDGKA